MADKREFDAAAIANLLLPTEFGDADVEAVAKQNIDDFEKTPRAAKLLLRRLAASFSTHPNASVSFFDSPRQDRLDRRLFSRVDVIQARAKIRNARGLGVESIRNERRYDAENAINKHQRHLDRIDSARRASSAFNTIAEMQGGIDDAKIRISRAEARGDLASAEELHERIEAFRDVMDRAYAATEGRNQEYWSRQLVKATRGVGRTELKAARAKTTLTKLKPRVGFAEAVETSVASYFGKGAVRSSRFDRTELNLRFRRTKQAFTDVYERVGKDVPGRSELRRRSRELESRRIDAIKRLAELTPSEIFDRIQHPAVFSKIVDLAADNKAARDELVRVSKSAVDRKGGKDVRAIRKLSVVVGARAEQLDQVFVAVGNVVVNLPADDARAQNFAGARAKYNAAQSVGDRHEALANAGRYYVTGLIHDQMQGISDPDVARRYADAVIGVGVTKADVTKQVHAALTPTVQPQTRTL